MTLNWQTMVVPTGMQFNSSDTSFNNELFNFLVPLEAPQADQRQAVKMVPNANHSRLNPTIGIGFDLWAGGSQVQAAVFAQMGIVTSVMTCAPKS